MLRRLVPVLVALCLALPAAPRAEAAGSPRVTRILVKKGAHTMQLLSKDEVLATYRVAIGPGGAGPKKREGDRVTPVGRYHVISHTPSQFKVFLGLDYPNAQDWARFRELKKSGELPKEATIGSAIGIHGPPVSLPDEAKASINERDWTLGCIAVDDADITEIAAKVRDGTIVDIED